MKRFKLLSLIMAALILTSALALMETPVIASEETLTIRGDGVERELIFSRAELENMDVRQYTYSIINNFPTARVDYLAGIPLMELLDQAGLKSSAKLLTFIASDGYRQTFTVEQLFAPRYYFPAEGERIAVPPIVCLQSGSAGFRDLEQVNLRLIMGQSARSEQNNPWFVRFLSTIEVSNEEPAKWPAVTFNRTVGDDGVTLRLQHENFDSVKIYYTTDGSAPTVESSMYNVSATRFQPELNLPLLIDKTTVVRAIAIGPGRENSDVSAITISFDDAMFDDLTGFGWAREAIEELAKSEIVNGVGNNRFDPSGNLTRAMFVTMLGRALNPDADAPPGEDRRFPDVNYDSWYGMHVEWAVETGIVRGHADGTFRPNDNVTVEHMLLMAERAGLSDGAANFSGPPGDASRQASRAEAAVTVFSLMQQTG